VDRELFAELRALRLAIARDRRVPPYVIFHDTTLRELARIKPSDIEALRHVYGVGARKAEDLGEAILQTIRRYATSGAPG
jgi:ATP-dependent DNA helicase RecQ